MSDYMFTLESHLSADQRRVVSEVQALAAHAGVNVFLTGGAMRDMLGGFPVRDLDFTVEGNALKLAKAAAEKHRATILSQDENRRSAELRFPGGVTAELAMARTERFGKPGAKPQISPATIHDDLRSRDFTMNAIALSLNKASLGLLLDPNNGLADIERKELRVIGNYGFYDDPVRLLRLMRFRVRLGYQIEERTRSQYENAREAGMHLKISAEELGEELRQIAGEVNAGDMLKTLEDEKLIGLYLESLGGAKSNLPGFAKLQKARQLFPHGVDLNLSPMPVFLDVLMEKLNAKERAALIKSAALRKSEITAWQKLPPAAKKLEREMKSPKLSKPSQVYQALIKAPGEQLLWLLLHSQQRIVQDRIKNYLAKYLPAALEVTDAAVTATGVAPGSPKFARAKEEMIRTTLDARPKKVPPPEPPPPPPPTPAFGRGMGMRSYR